MGSLCWIRLFRPLFLWGHVGVREKVNLEFMFLVLLLLFIYTFMQHRKVKARNAKISSINRQLTDTNDKLVRLYDQNRAINHSLSDANLIKEGYIGTFFGLCSTYIDQADKTI